MAGARLDGVNLSNTSLLCADFSHAKLANAKFIHTDLCGSTFLDTDLYNADFSDAVLQNAAVDDEGAFAVRDTTFTSSRVDQADFNHADLTGTKFFNMNLWAARNITEEQLNKAYLEEGCIMPPDFPKPKYWKNQTK